MHFKLTNVLEHKLFAVWLCDFILWRRENDVGEENCFGFGIGEFNFGFYREGHRGANSDRKFGWRKVAGSHF